MNILGTCLEMLLMTNEEIFKKYVSTFDISSPPINRKLYHSFRVSEISKKIASSLNLGDDLVKLATFIGLVHDIGRFTQWKNYGTYVDFDSEDHASLGVKILFEDHIIDEFIIDSKWNNVIYNAVKNHNEYMLNSKVDEVSLLMAKILRDADKLDILYMVASGLVSVEQSDAEVSKEVNKEFLEKKCIEGKYLKNSTDKSLLRLALVFDLNFEYSLNCVLVNKYLQSIYERVKNKKIIEPYYMAVKNYLKEKCSGKI